MDRPGVKVLRDEVILAQASFLPEPAVREATNRPTFERIQLQPFDCRISPDLSRHSLFDIFSEFCPHYIVDKWVEYINARYIFLPNHIEGPRPQHSLYNT